MATLEKSMSLKLLKGKIHNHRPVYAIMYKGRQIGIASYNWSYLKYNSILDNNLLGQIVDKDFIKAKDRYDETLKLCKKARNLADVLNALDAL